MDTFLELKDLLCEHAMFATGLLLLTGYIIGEVAGKCRLPEITGYIVAGLLLGESVAGVFPKEMSHSFTIITEIALGLIALTIGAEFSISKLKRIGSAAVIITAAQIIATFVLVTGGLWFVGMDIPFALLLGAIATATAPAATVAVVQSLRARGKFIDYLYSVVALDDAGCVILFGLVFAFTSRMLGAGGADGGAGAAILHAFGEVFFSILVGVVAGLILHKMTQRKTSNNEIMIIALSTVFLSTAVAIVFHLSPLLTNMAAGCVLVNLAARNHRIFRILEPLTPPLYALFFVIAGTELNLAVIFKREILILGAVYIVARSIGKYGGVWLGCLASRIGEPIRGNLGWCMLPQAGVAIGLVLLVQTAPALQPAGLRTTNPHAPHAVHAGPAEAAAPATPAMAETKEKIKSPAAGGLTEAQFALIGTMVNIVLLSVFVNELIGPPLSKMAIIRGNQMEDR